MPSSKPFALIHLCTPGGGGIPHAATTNLSPRTLPPLPHALPNPLQILLAPLPNLQRHKLRHIITVQPLHFSLQLHQPPRRRLHHQQMLPRLFHLPAPPVHSPHRPQRNIHASRQPFCHHALPNHPRFLQRSARHQHHSRFTALFHRHPPAQPG